MELFTVIIWLIRNCFSCDVQQERNWEFMNIRCYIGNGKITNYSYLTRLQINVYTTSFSNRQFDSFFDTTHTVIGMTCAKVKGNLKTIQSIKARNYDDIAD